MVGGGCCYKNEKRWNDNNWIKHITSALFGALGKMVDFALKFKQALQAKIVSLE